MYLITMAEAKDQRTAVPWKFKTLSEKERQVSQELITEWVLLEVIISEETGPSTQNQLAM